MKIGIAQLHPVKGDIAANIEKHKELIELAVSLEATSVFFPELSLTAYEPTLAKILAITFDDERLDCFQNISDDKRITVGLGVPTQSKTGTLISMVIFQPESPRQIYSKQQLHVDEFPYFESGDQQILITVGDKRIFPAICYESLQEDHSKKASELGADIYLASVAKSQNGLDKAISHFAMVARKYSMPVLMSNCIGYCDDFLSVGNSSVWNKQGALVGQLTASTEGVLVFDTETEEVTLQAL